MKNIDRPALKKIVITPEMIAAGKREMVLDVLDSNRAAPTFNVLAACLEAGGYEVIDLSGVP